MKGDYYRSLGTLSFSITDYRTEEHLQGKVDYEEGGNIDKENFVAYGRTNDLRGLLKYKDPKICTIKKKNVVGWMELMDC